MSAAKEGKPMRRNELVGLTIGVALAVALLNAGAPAAAFAAEPAAPAKTDSLGWHKDLTGSFNFTQASFSNWAAGGVDNVSWLAGAHGRFKRFGGVTNWTTNLRFEYGQVKEKDQQAKKSFDLIFLETIVDFNTSRLVKPYARASGKTQFAAGYKYETDTRTRVSDFADPLYLEQGAGVGYQAGQGLITRLGVGLKETFARDFAAIYTDDKDTADKIEKRRIEGGAESVTELDRNFGKQLGVKSRLALFWPFNDTSRLDVDWMTDVTLKAIGALGVTFKFEALYNKTILDKVQWQQVLGIGLTYRFM
jgi:hypothetical protein